MLNVEVNVIMEVENMGKCYFLGKRKFCKVKKEHNVCPNNTYLCHYYINTKPELFISDFKLTLVQLSRLGKDSVPIPLKGLLLKYFR